MCGEHFNRRTNWFLYDFAELGAMATDLAEFLGATLGFYLLFGIPLIYAGLLSGAIIFIILYFERYGQRVVEIIITSLIGVVCIGFIVDMILSKPNWAQVGLHTLIPSLPTSQALFIAVGMIGATVMPHVIYLHSQLVQTRNHDKTIEGKKNT